MDFDFDANIIVCVYMQVYICFTYSTEMCVKLFELEGNFWMIKSGANCMILAMIDHLRQVF